MGRRFGGLKQLAPVGPHGEAILDYTVYDAFKAGFDRIVLAIRREIEDAVRDHVARGFGRSVEVSYAFQDELAPTLPPLRQKPWGTVHAVLACRGEVGDRFAVANGDDLYGRHALQTASEFLDRPAALDLPTWGLIGYRAATTLPPEGAVTRGVLQVTAGLLSSIEEIAAMERHPTGVCWRDGYKLEIIGGETLVSMNLWSFNGAVFDLLEQRFRSFLAADPGADEELPLPVALGELISGRQGRVNVLPTTSQWCGITAADDRAWVVRRLADQIAQGRYPARLWAG